MKSFKILKSSQGWDNRWTYIKRGNTEAKLWVFTTPRMQFSWVEYTNEIFSMVFEKYFFDQVFYFYFGQQLQSMRVNYRLALKEEGVDAFVV